MKILEVISTSKDGMRREVIGEHNGMRSTFHIHKHPKGWMFDKGGKNFAPVKEE